MTTKKPRITHVTQIMLTRSGEKPCNLCGVKISLSEEIVTKSSSSTGKFCTKWYHIGCARRVNII